MALTDGLREHRAGVVVLDELAGLAGARDVEERRPVGDAGRLLHVVRHDHDRVVLLQLLDQVLDGEGGDRVERRAGLVHQQHVGRDRDGAGDAEPLLLAAGEAVARQGQAVLDLVPEVRAPQRLLDEVVAVATSRCRLLFSFTPASTLSRIDIVGNGFGRWNTMPTWRRTSTGSTPWAVEVVAVDQHLALDAGAGDDLVHAVQGAEEGRLAAAGRADEGRDGAGLDGEGHALDGPEARRSRRSGR